MPTLPKTSKPTAWRILLASDFPKGSASTVDHQRAAGVRARDLRQHPRAVHQRKAHQPQLTGVKIGGQQAGGLAALPTTRLNPSTGKATVRQVS
jgi:hypothetical protein